MRYIFLISLISVLFTGKIAAQPVSSIDSSELSRLCNALGGGTPNNIQAWNAALPAANSWSISNPVSSWYGVTLVNVGGINRVSKIDLGGLPLTNNLAVLATPISGMDFLQEIHLDSCRLSGFIAPFLGNLPILEHIDISYNDLDYSMLSFNDLITNQTALKILKARASFDTLMLGSQLVVPITASSLEFVDFGMNGFTGTIPNFNIFFPNLQIGYFDINNFDSLSLQSNSRLTKLVISNNKFRNINNLYRVLDQASSLQFLIANAALDTAGLYHNFAPQSIAPISIDPKYIEMRSNNLTGVMDLNYFGVGTETKKLDLSFNLLDSLMLPFCEKMEYLNLSFNRISMPLDSLFFDGFDLKNLFLNNNNFSGTLPNPPAGGYYNCNNLRELDLSNNPQISGNLRLDWLFGGQTVSPLEYLRVSDNDFDNITPVTAFFPSLIELKVDRNRFHFDDLYSLTNNFQLRQITVANNPSGSPVQHYVPLAHISTGLPIADSIGVFRYFPQDSAGIGGVRRRPAGDSVVFHTTVGCPQNVVHNVFWMRDSVGGVQQPMGQLEAVDTSGGFQTSSTLQWVTMAPDSNSSAIKISNLDSLTHSDWLIRAETRHDSFPLLMIPVRPKKLKVGQCYDDFGGVTLCQQMVVQFQDTVSNEGKERVRREFGVEVIDSCVCGAIELWAFPDTLNRVEMENLGTGTRTSSSQANNKAELLSADPNYSLLDQGNGSALKSATFTVGATASNPTLVALIDSGVDYDKAEIVNRFWVKQSETDNDGTDTDNDCEIDNAWGWNYLNRNNITYDDHGHGTSVAGVIAGYNPGNLSFNNTTSDRIAIVPYKYTDKGGNGTVFHAACGLRHAADYRDTLSNGNVARVRVINASWGYYGEPCMVLENAILYSGRQCDVLIVSSAGNKGLNTQIDSAKHWPSNSPFVADSTESYNDNVLAVAALDSSNYDRLAWYSNYSAKHIDVAAPGSVDIFTANDSTNTLIRKEGTSFAAPQVTRIAALLFDEFPDAGAGAVKYAIMMGVDTLQSADSTKIKSGGRINYQKARNILMNITDRTICDESGFIVSSEMIENKQIGELAAVFPNPFSNELQIIINNDLLNAEALLEITVTDISGRTVYAHKTTVLDNFMLSTENFSPGLYFISLKNGVTKQIAKVIKL